MILIFIILLTLTTYANQPYNIIIENSNKNDSIIVLDKHNNRFILVKDFPYHFTTLSKTQLTFLRDNQIILNANIYKDTLFYIDSINLYAPQTNIKKENSNNKYFDYINSSFSNIISSNAFTNINESNISINSAPQNSSMFFYNNIPIFGTQTSKTAFDMFSLFQIDNYKTNFIYTTPDNTQNLSSTINAQFFPKDKFSAIGSINSEGLIYFTGPFSRNLSYAFLYRNSIYDKIFNKKYIDKYPDNRLPNYYEIFSNLLYHTKKFYINAWFTNFEYNYSINKIIEDSVLYSANDISKQISRNKLYSIQGKFNINSNSSINLDISNQTYNDLTDNNIFSISDYEKRYIKFYYFNLNYQIKSKNFELKIGSAPTKVSQNTIIEKNHLDSIIDISSTSKENKIFINNYLLSNINYNRIFFSLGTSINYNNFTNISKYLFAPLVSIGYKPINQLKIYTTYAKSILNPISITDNSHKISESISLNFSSNIINIGQAKLSIFLKNYYTSNSNMLLDIDRNIKSNFCRGINVQLLSSNHDKKFYNDITYSFIKSIETTADNKKIYSPYDRTNSLNINSNYTVYHNSSKKLTIKNVFSFSNGTPYNIFFVDTLVSSNIEYYKSSYNNYARFPFYMNNNLSINFYFYNKKISYEIYLAFYNLFNRKNIQNYILNTTTGTISKSYYFPKSIVPYLGVEVRF